MTPDCEAIAARAVKPKTIPIHSAIQTNPLLAKPVSTTYRIFKQPLEPGRKEPELH